MPASILSKLPKPRGQKAITVTVGEKLSVKCSSEDRFGHSVASYDLSFEQGKESIKTDINALFVRQPTDTMAEVVISVESLRKVVSVLDTDDAIRFRIVTNRPAPIEFESEETRPVKGLIMPIVFNKDDHVWSHPDLNRKEQANG